MEVDGAIDEEDLEIRWTPLLVDMVIVVVKVEYGLLVLEIVVKLGPHYVAVIWIDLDQGAIELQWPNRIRRLIGLLGR